MSKYSLGLDLARALNNKLAGTELLSDIIHWWRVAAIDSGYFDSMQEFISTGFQSS